MGGIEVIIKTSLYAVSTVYVLTANNDHVKRAETRTVRIHFARLKSSSRFEK